MPFSRNRAGMGGGPSRASGGTGATVGFGAVAAAAAFAVAVHRAARSRSPVSPSDIKSSIMEDGTIPELEALLQQIADKGLDPGVRPEVWPLLLGVYGANETYEHRAASYKSLREGFQSLLRRCQELEAACLEATSSSRRSARASSSCGGPQQSTNSTATSATASPLYSKSPANAACRPAGLSAAAAGPGAAIDVPSVPTPIYEPVCEDGSWEKAGAAAAAAAAAVATAAAATADWEDEGPGLGHADAFSASSEVSFLGHVSRADVPPALRPYWEAQQSIALDAVRVDFKKSTLPGATPLATAAGSGSSGGAASGLTLSLRGLGFTGLSSSGNSVASATATPSASALSPPASAPVSADPGSDGGGAATGAPAAASSGRLTSWFREKYEEYRASRQQQPQEREQEHQQHQHQQQDQEQGDAQELQEFQEGSFGLVPRPPSLKEEQAQPAAPAASSAGARLAARPQQQAHEQMAEEGPAGTLQAAADGGAIAVAHETQLPAAAGGAGGGGVAAASRIWRSDGGALGCEAADAAATVTRTAHASLSGLPPSLGGGGDAAPPATAARPKPLSSVFAAFAFSSGAVSATDEPRDAVCGTASSAPPAASPAGSPASAACSGPRVGGGGSDDGGPAAATGRASSSFFSFTSRMRQLASAPTLTPPGPAASCPSSPLLQTDSSAVANGRNGPNGHQQGQDRSASASSLPSVSTSPRHTSEGGGVDACGFAQLQGREAAAAADGAAAAAAAAAGGGSGCPAPSCPPFPPCLSALARAQLEHARHYFSPGQMRLVERLVSLLSAYAAHDPGLGYCQGMSDLALPFVLLLEDDVMAFWCFVRFMGKVRANFVPGPDGAFERLATLGSLVARLDEQVGAHLSAIHAGHCHFAHRMVAAQMRRELVPELAVRVWEQLWADDLLEQMAAEAAVGQEETIVVGRKAAETAAPMVGAVELQELGANGVGRLGNGERGGGGVMESGREAARVEAEGAPGDTEGVFGNGGVAAASAALTASAGDGSEAAAPGGGANVGVSLRPCAPAEPPRPDGTGAEAMADVRSSAGCAGMTHGSCRVLAATAAATHGTIQGRPAAVSYSEGVTSRAPPVAVGVSCSGLASALSCEDAVAPAERQAGAGEPPLPLADAATPEAIVGKDAASARTCGGAKRAPAPAPAFGRELFLYLVAAVVLSQRRRLLECRELDDVLRLFQSLPPMSRSDVNEALRKAREYRDIVVPRQRRPPAPPADGGRSSAASPPERIWRLLSLRSDPPAAKL